MLEKEQNYQLPKQEIKEKEEKEEEKSIEEKEITFPDLAELDSTLKEANEIADNASLSEKEIDEMAEKYKNTAERIKDIDLIQEERLRRVENYNPLKDLTPADYTRLVQEGIINSEYADRLQTIDSIINKLESLESPTTDAMAELEKLANVRNEIREKIENLIEEKQEEISGRKEKIRNEIFEHYAKRIEELENVIKEIEKNPRAIERIKIIEEKEREEFEKTKKAEEERLFSEASRFIQSLNAKHNNAIKRLIEITKDKDVVKKLSDSLSFETKEKQNQEFKKVRSKLITAIIEGEGENQLKEAKEVVPWETKTSSIRYFDAFNTLQEREVINALQKAAKEGDTQAEQLLKQRDQIIAENNVLRKLIGKKWIIDNKTGKKRLGTFWSAFETRKENDEKGITAERKKKREEKEKQEKIFQEKAKELIKKGGIIAEVPLVKWINRKPRVIGKEKSIVRLEKKKSKKGNDYWEVVEIVGQAKGFRVGTVSPLDMRAFPYWLRNAAKKSLESLEENKEKTL